MLVHSRQSSFIRFNNSVCVPVHVSANRYSKCPASATLTLYYNKIKHLPVHNVRHSLVVVVSRYRDTQLQVTEKSLICNISPYCMSVSEIFFTFLTSRNCEKIHRKKHYCRHQWARVKLVITAQSLQLIQCQVSYSVILQ